MVNLKCEPSRVYPAVPRRAHRQVPRRPLRRGARSRITTLRASAHMSPSSGTLNLCVCHRLPGRGGRGRRASAAALRLRADRWSLDECHVRRRTRRPARPATARLPPGLAPAGPRKAGRLHSDRVGPAASAAGLPHSAPGSCRRRVGWWAPRVRQGCGPGVGVGGHSREAGAPGDGGRGAGRERGRIPRGWGHRGLAGCGAAGPRGRPGAVEKPGRAPGPRAASPTPRSPLRPLLGPVVLLSVLRPSFCSEVCGRLKPLSP